MITTLGAPFGACAGLVHAGTESATYLPIFPANAGSGCGNADGVDGCGHPSAASAACGIALDTIMDATKAEIRLDGAAMFVRDDMKPPYSSLRHRLRITTY